MSVKTRQAAAAVYGGGSTVAGQAAAAGTGHTILLLDPLSVDSAAGVRFRLCPPRKHPLNPVLLPADTDCWDSLQVTWPATVLYSAADRTFRCWYAGLDAVQAPGRYWQTGYAESGDGIHWARPGLGQAKYLGRDTNRVVLPFNPGAMLRCVFANPDQSAPGKRFGSLSLQDAKRADGAGYLRAALGWSADGKVWTSGGVAYEAPGNGRLPYQDICQVFFEPAHHGSDDRVKGFSQIIRDRLSDGRPKVRNIGLAHGPCVEQLADAADPVLLRPEPGLDEELHGGSVHRTGDTYVMLIESGVYSTKPLHGDLRLAVSRDGRTFRRVHPQTPFLATGARGTWDENLLICTAVALQEVGDELYLYYIGCPNVYTSWPLEYAVSPDRRGSLLYPTYMGLAVLDRDRFGYATGSGSLLTHAVTLAETGVWLNADGDGLGVEAIDQSGATLARGTLGQERLQTVYRRVAWEREAPLGTAHLRVTLDRRNRLYSLRY